MKTILHVLFIFSLSVTFAQESKTTLRKELNALSTTEALDGDKMSPKVFLGQIARNPANNNLELDLNAEMVKLQGVLGRTAGGKILTIDISGENENKTLALFNGTKINPKVKGTLLATIPVKTWLSYNVGENDSIFNKMVIDSIESLRRSKKAYYVERRLAIEAHCKAMSNKGFPDINVLATRTKKMEQMKSDSISYFLFVENNLKYDLLLERRGEFQIKRKNYSFFSFGVQVEGAKYNLFQTDTTPDFVVEKMNYSGWNTFGQLNILNYNLLKDRMAVHTFQGEFGETNNVNDLTEYNYTESQTSTSGNQSVVRKITGYVDPYFVQNKAVLSYEVNFYPMNPETKQIGYLLGADFTYFSKRSNRMGLHTGLNFPVVRKGNTDKRPFYISAIVRSLDPLNWAQDSGFMFKNTVQFALRFAAPIGLNFSSVK